MLFDTTFFLHLIQHVLGPPGSDTMFTKPEEESYQPLAERIDESEEDDSSTAFSNGSRRCPPALKWIAAVAALVATSVISMQFGAFMASRPGNLDAECAEHTAQWCKCGSPAFCRPCG